EVLAEGDEVLAEGDEVLAEGDEVLAESSIDEVGDTVSDVATEKHEAVGQSFFRIETADGLTITTCDYDEWLNWQLENAGWTPEPEATAGEDVIEAAMSAISTVAAIGKEVRFSQWIEPFAMISPQDGHTLEQIEEFLAWVAEQHPSESLKNVVAARLVGSSPIIATIEEAYSPYDITVGRSVPTTHDYVTWNDGLFVSRNQPFCIHSCLKVREPGWGPLAPATVEQPMVVEDETVNPGVAIDSIGADIVGSPECLQDEWFSQAGLIWQEAESVGQGLRPNVIGSSVAQVVVTCDEYLGIAANRLALVWPKEKRRVQPVAGAGAKLLARAEVAEQEESEVAVNTPDDAELAQATAILMQWVDTTQEVMNEVSKRWSGVAEVARNRGAQDDSQKR
ncbi:MAG: hypothetical protein AAFX06_31520, partial [Planctomycetota bacterium]